MPKLQLHNEPLLVEAMQAGSEEAFTTLYRFYSPLLYINIHRMLRDPAGTEELVQELFTRIWQNREAKGIKENFTGYVYRVAQHLVYDFFRDLKKDRSLMERFKEMIAAETELTAEDKFHRQQTATIINNAIEHLPPQQKKVYKLVKCEGHTYKKAAEDLGISPFTVKEYLSLANKSIRNYILAHSDSAREMTMLILLFFGFL